VCPLTDPLLLPHAKPPSTTKRRRAPRADAPELAGIEVAAEFLDIHPRTIRRMIRDGQLRAYRVGKLVKVDMKQVYELAQPVPPETIGA
jgi:excisionase family DNA binding protein